MKPSALQIVMEAPKAVEEVLRLELETSEWTIGPRSRTVGRYELENGPTRLYRMFRIL